MEKVKVKKESPSKQTNVKSDKANAKKNVDTGKKVEDPQNIRHYAVISPESIKVMAESTGICDLSEEVSASLAEDISYKLREVVHVSITAQSNILIYSMRSLLKLYCIWMCHDRGTIYLSIRYTCLYSHCITIGSLRLLLQ